MTTWPCVLTVCQGAKWLLVVGQTEGKCIYRCWCSCSHQTAIPIFEAVAKINYELTLHSTKHFASEIYNAKYYQLSVSPCISYLPCCLPTCVHSSCCYRYCAKFQGHLSTPSVVAKATVYIVDLSLHVPAVDSVQDYTTKSVVEVYSSQ